MTSEPPTAAFFDFDRTVLDGDAGVLFGKELVRLRRRRVRDDRRGTVAWVGRSIAYEARTARLYGEGAFLRVATGVGLVKRSHLLRTAYRFLAGLRHDDLASLGQDFFDEVLAERIFPDARATMESHRQAGRRVVIVSTGMELLLQRARRHLPVDDVLAVQLLQEDGILTGDVRGPLWGAEKATAVRDYAHARELSLPRSHAYSDHYSDLRLLQLAGHPTAVNPDLRLRWHARRRRWPIVRWRRAPSKALSNADG